MKLMKSIRVMIVLTGLALIYVYMQMEIVSLAYEGKRKERQIIELNESTGAVAYKILQLKSSNHLGGNLLSENSPLHFQDNRSVVELVSKESFPSEESAALAVSSHKSNPIVGFFFKAPPEARAEEQSDVIKPWRRSR
ncbi:MAG: hypothetical protein H6754_05845 [Candidatus Omnitrophica bacterium]|nr:hypothetical protein [Candidatus Omnitrophota bacterium]